MAQKDRKTAKLRGSRTCGYGNAQKHRGAGSRGGRGMAGSKDQKWSWIVKNKPDYLGRKGFKRPKSIVKNHRITNVGYLGRNIDALLERGIAKKEGEKFHLDMTKTGYDKLLGSGSINVPLDIIVFAASPKAIEKINNAGGTVKLSKQSPENESGQISENGG